MSARSPRGGEGPRRTLLLPWLLIAATFLVAARLADHLGHLEPFRIDASDVRVRDLPPWAVAREAEVLGRAPAFEGSYSIFDPELAPRIRARYEARPWVRRVARIRRRFPGTVDVHLELRRPVAVLCAGVERLAIDREGVLLEEDSRIPSRELPEIRVQVEPVRRVPRVGGAFWQEPVHEALGVLAALERHRDHPVFERTRLVEVRVGRGRTRRLPGGSEILLRLENGTWLRWGRAPDALYGELELTTDEKLAHLWRVMRRYPLLHDLGEVDLRFRDPMVVPRNG